MKRRIFAVEGADYKSYWRRATINQIRLENLKKLLARNSREKVEILRKSKDV
jgi:hypothetical protein